MATKPSADLTASAAQGSPLTASRCGDAYGAGGAKGVEFVPTSFQVVSEVDHPKGYCVAFQAAAAAAGAAGQRLAAQQQRWESRSETLKRVAADERQERAQRLREQQMKQRRAKAAQEDARRRQVKETHLQNNGRSSSSSSSKHLEEQTPNLTPSDLNPKPSAQSPGSECCTAASDTAELSKTKESVTGRLDRLQLEIERKQLEAAERRAQLREQEKLRLSRQMQLIERVNEKRQEFVKGRTEMLQMRIMEANKRRSGQIEELKQRLQQQSKEAEAQVAKMREEIERRVALLKQRILEKEQQAQQLRCKHLAQRKNRAAARTEAIRQS